MDELDSIWTLLEIGSKGEGGVPGLVNRKEREATENEHRV